MRSDRAGRAQTDQPHTMKQRGQSSRSQSDTHLTATRAPPPILQIMPQRPDGRCFYSHPQEFSSEHTNNSIRVKNYPNRPDLERVRYLGEWTIICNTQHVHTVRCMAAATGKGQVTLPPKKPGQAEVVLTGWFDEGRPTTESHINPVVEYEEQLELEEHPALASQPVPYKHLQPLRSRSDGSQPMEPLQPSPPPPVSSVASSSRDVASSAPVGRVRAPIVPLSVKLSLLWYPSEGASNARKMRVVQSGPKMFVHATDFAGLIDRTVSHLRTKVQPPNEVQMMAVPASGQPVHGHHANVLSAMGVRKLLETTGINDKPLKWIKSVLLPAMDKAGPDGGDGAAAMEDEQKHAWDDQEQTTSTQSIERMPSGRARSSASSHGGSAAPPSSASFVALNSSSSARSAAASSAAAATVASLPSFPQSSQQSASSSSSASFFGMIRDDRVRDPISLNDVNARALEDAAANRCGMPSKRAWDADPFVYRGFLRKTPQGELLRHGLGQSTYDSGSVFIGEYRDGECNGKGRWTTYDALGNAHIYEGDWVNDREEGKGEVKWTDADLGLIVARGSFVGGLQHGDECTWTLASGHVYFKGRMEKGQFADGRLTFEDDNEYYEGPIRGGQFHGVGCYAWPDGSFFFGSFRYNQSNGLGVFFLPRADDGPVSDWLTADREPFDMYAVVSKQDGVHALWRRKEGEEDGMINGAAGSASSSSSPPAAAAAAAASSASSAAASSSDGGGDAKLVWQALDRLIKRAVPVVIHLQYERKQATNPSSALPPPSDHHVSECVRAARAHFSSPALFDLISVPNAVHDLRRKGGCSYLVTGELGCAESPYLCLTCAGDPELQDESATWEMCQGCAEHSSCHAGHSLRALPPRRRFVCDCGRRHALLAANAASASSQAPSLSLHAAGGASKAAAAHSAASIEDDHDDAASESAVHVCAGMQVLTSPSEWAKAVWPAAVAQAEQATQAKEDKASMDAME